VLSKFEAEGPQGPLDLLVERLLEIGPGLALLVLLVTVVTSATQLVELFRIGVGVI
jgi:hypothetical protein